MSTFKEREKTHNELIKEHDERVKKMEILFKEYEEIVKGYKYACNHGNWYEEFEIDSSLDYLRNVLTGFYQRQKHIKKYPENYL